MENQKKTSHTFLLIQPWHLAVQAFLLGKISSLYWLLAIYTGKYQEILKPDVML